MVYHELSFAYRMQSGKHTGSSLELLTNKELIALNQDPLGLQAYVVQHENEGYVLVKDIEQKTWECTCSSSLQSFRYHLQFLRAVLFTGIWRKRKST